MEIEKRLMAIFGNGYSFRNQKGAKDMELCDTCKKTLCEKNMEIVKQSNLVIIRCKEYEKDASKIQGYKRQLCRTARQYHTLMNLNI